MKTTMTICHACSKLLGSTNSITKQCFTAAFLMLILFSGCKKSQTITANQPLTAIAENSNLKTNSTGPDFTIAVIPDPQFYTDGELPVSESYAPNAKYAMFQDQIQWIVDHQVSDNIAYVITVGDLSNHGDLNGDPQDDYAGLEFPRIKPVLYKLDTANVPWGACVGDHDQTPNGSHGNGTHGTGYDTIPGGPISSTTNRFNAAFGVSHFTGKPWYGGHYSTNNDTHYDLFTAGGVDFIVIYLEFDLDNEDPGINTWAYNLLGTYASRKAIIVSHSIGRAVTPSTFSAQGQRVYTKLKTRPNVFMFVSGHVLGEGYRQDKYNGSTIKTFVADYQGYADASGIHNGGNGYMRLMKVSTANDLITVKTYSPYLSNNGLPLPYETDANSQFTKPLFHELTRTCDFNNDGKSQFAFFKDGSWIIQGSSNINYGQPGYVAVTADYDGDGQTDRGVLNPNTFNWVSPVFPTTQFGAAGDIPVPADYDGDGKADIAVWRPSNATWYVKGIITQAYGLSTHIPVPGDYDGDGKADFAVVNPTSLNWASTAFATTQFGAAGDIPVPGDYNGDGKCDIAVFRPSNGTWYIKGQTSVVYGQSGDIPAPGDYDGDGKTDEAVYRPSTGTFMILNGTSTVTGGTGYKLVNLPYNIRHFFFP